MTQQTTMGFMVLALLSAAGSVGFASAQGVETSGARLLEIDGVAGQVDIRTSPRAAFNVEIIPGKKLSARVERDGIILRIKGPLSTNVRTNCENSENGGNRDATVSINGTRYAPDDLPRIIISGPDTIGFRVKHALIGGTVGNVGGATIEHRGCGNLTLGNVARDLQATVLGSGDFVAGTIGGKVEANLAGSGDVLLGNIARSLELNVAGSGDTRIGQITGKSEINVAGSGGVEIGSVASAIKVNIAGSGDVTLRAGRAQLAANIAGSGNVRHNGIAVNPEVSIVGSGDVSVARVEGQPRVSKRGSGEFRVN